MFGGSIISVVQIILIVESMTIIDKVHYTKDKTPVFCKYLYSI